MCMSDPETKNGHVVANGYRSSNGASEVDITAGTLYRACLDAKPPSAGWFTLTDTLFRLGLAIGTFYRFLLTEPLSLAYFAWGWNTQWCAFSPRTHCPQPSDSAVHQPTTIASGSCHTPPPTRRTRSLPPLHDLPFLPSTPPTHPGPTLARSPHLPMQVRPGCRHTPHILSAGAPSLPLCRRANQARQRGSQPVQQGGLEAGRPRAGLLCSARQFRLLPLLGFLPLHLCLLWQVAPSLPPP